jgi:PTS system nitrogen regulatory IIA component
LPLPPEIDRNLLLKMLLQREELASTGVGRGIAIPHPRYPLNELKEEIISTFFLEKEIDFGSIDGIPVFVLFLMLSPEIRLHLRYLSKLSLCLRDDSFIDLLKKCKKAEEIFEKVEEIEKALPVVP